MIQLSTLKKSGLTLALLLITLISRAQLSGTITVPNLSYPDLATVISALNTQGVGAGGVTINVTAGSTLTTPVGGYQLGSATLNASVSASKQIVFNGNGNTLSGFAGVGTSDGIFWIAGTDYVTVNNFVFAENSANTNLLTQMEYGLALVKLNAAAPFDGTQNNTIKNCVFNMVVGSTTNTTSTAVLLAHTQANSITVLGTTGVLATDANSNNVFYNNTVNSSTNGFRFVGINNNAAYDYNNVIGAPGNGNTFVTGGGTTIANAIVTQYDNLMTISSNNFTIASTQSPTATVYMIYPYNGIGNLNIVNNNFNISSTLTSASTYVLYNYNVSSGGHQDATATFNFKNNTVTGTNTAATSGYLYGMYNYYSNFYADSIVSNTYNNITWGAATSTSYLYLNYNYYGNTPYIYYKSNNITNIQKNGSTTGGYLYANYVYDYPATTGLLTYENNLIQNVNVNYYMYGHVSYPGYTATPAAGVGQVLKNRFNKIDKVVINNGGYMYGYYAYYGTVGNELAFDTLSNCKQAGTGGFYMLYDGLYTGDVHDNYIANDTISNSGTVYSLYYLTGNQNVYNNTITGLTNTGTSGTIYGMYFSSVTTGANVYNNVISDFRATGALSSATAMFGMYLSASSNYKIYNNTIRLAPVSTGANFGVKGIYYTSGTSLIDLRNNIINVNVTPLGTGVVACLQPSTGTAGVANVSLAATSNNNIYYSPNVANSYLFAEGATTATTFTNAYKLSNDANFNTSCGLYKAYMAPRESNTFTENNLVATTAGKYAPSGNSYAEGGAQVITSPLINQDINGAARSATYPDMGAVEFSGIGTDASAPAIALNPLPNFACTTVPTQNVAITDYSGVNVAAGTKPRLYFKRSTDNNALVGNTASDNGWKYVEATNAVSPFTFSFDFSLLFAASTAPYIATGDVIQYFLVAQDNNSTANVGVTGASLFAGYCPTSVALPVAAFPIVNPKSFAITPASSVLVTASPNPVCQNTATTLTAALATTSNILPTGYATSNATSTADEEIFNVSLGIGGSLLNNTSSCATTGGAAGNGLPASSLNMYSNFTTTGLTVPSLASGQTIPYSLTVGYCGTTAFSNMYAVYIDYNRNGIFEATEQVVTSVYGARTFPSQAVTGTFTVPNNVAMGYTLMRVVLVESSAISPTGTYSWGETEDYVVNLQGSPATISWQAGTTIVGTTNPLTIVPTGSTNYIANVVDANGCAFVGGTSVTVNPAPTAPTATNSLQCGTQIPTASVASTAGAAGSGTMNWFSASTGGTLMQGNAYDPLSTYYTNDFSNLTFTNSFVTGVAAITGGQLVLNPNTTSQFGGLQVNAAGVNTNKQKIDFDLTTQGAATTNMADGFSFSYGDDATAANTPPNAENGSGTKLKIGFVYYTNGTSTQGTYLMYNCTTDEQAPNTSGVLAYNNTNLSYLMSTKHVTITIDSTGLLNMTVGGAPIFTNVQLPAAFVTADKSNWAYVFKARSGGIASGTIIDNVQIQTGAIVPGYTTYKTPISTTTTFYVSETGTNGCSSTRTPVTATVNIPDLLTASASNTVNVCVNTPITLSVTKTGTANTYAYTWYATPATGSGVATAGLAAPTNGTVTVTPTTAGSYIYTIGGFDGGVTPTCATTANVTVNVVDPWNGFAASINPSSVGVCNGNAVNLTSVINGPQTFPVGYPTSGASYTSDEEILNVSLGTGGSLLNVTSDCSTTAGAAGNGLPGSSNQLYSNYTTVSTVPVPTITTGQVVPISLTLGYCGTYAYTNGYSVFIDYNRNGSFTDPGELVFGSTTTTARALTGDVVSGTFTVPTTAAAGKTLMRVVYVESTASPVSNAVTGWGETEDYTVNISTSPASLTWKEGATTLGTTPVLAYNSSVVGPHTINYAATSALGGCILNSSNAVVTVNAIPTAPSISNSIQCGTKVPTNTATSTAGALGSGTFKWYTAPSGGTPIETTTTGNLVNYQVATTTTLYVSEMSVAGCESARTPFLVTVNPIDAIFASTSTTNACVNTPIALNVTKTGTQNIYAYNWTATPQVNSGLPVAGTAASLNVPIVAIPSAAGTYSYKVTGTEVATGCAVTSTVAVTVVDPWNGYTAIVSPSSSTICSGTSTTLNAYVLGPQGVPTGYAASSALYTGDEEILNVSLGLSGALLNNSSNCTTTAGVAGNGLNASVGQMYSNYTTVPSVAVPVLQASTIVPYSITLGYCGTYAYTNGYSMFIDFNRNGTFETTEKVAGSTATAARALTGDVVSGVFVVPSNVTPGKTLMRIVYVESNATPLPTGTYGWGETEDYLVDLVTATATSYTWKEGTTTLGTNNTLAYTGSVGTHYVNFASTSAQGCVINSQTATVNVLALPTAPTATNSAHCGTKIPTASVTKTSGTNGTGTFNWYTTPTGTTTAQVGTSTTFTSMISTTTTFYVSEVGVNGCESARTPVTIVVTPADAITAAASNTTNLCINTPLNLSVTQTGTNNTYLYTWTATPQAGSGIAVTGVPGATPTVTPTAAGTITYTVVGNQNGPAIYSNLAAISTVDEDCGNVTITQGATTILNNTSTIGSLTGTIGTASGAASQRSDFTAFGPYTLNANGTYNLSVSSITSGTFYYNGMGVYIDYNRNGSFADAGEAVYVSTTTQYGPHTETATFTVPATALNGLTRMRVIVNEGTVATPETAPTWGEVEEYAINLVTPNIGGGNPTTGCSVYSSVNVNVINPWVGITASVTPSVANICGLGTPVSLTGTSGGPTTLPTGYSASSATSTSDDEILAVSLGAGGSLLNNTSSCATTGGAAGNGLPASVTNLYSNYTTVSTVAVPSIAPGATIPWSLTLGYCSGIAYSTGYSIFIDFNRNGSFTDLGELVAGSTATATYAVTGSVVNGTFTVPTTASAGKTLMRVVMTEFSASPTSTGSYSWGETEDYAVMIGTSAASQTWTEATTTLGTNTTLAYTPTSFGTKTITYTAADANGCKISANATLNVSQPAAPTVANVSLCQNTTATALTATALTGHTVKWYTTATGGTALASAPIPSTTTVGTTTYYATQTTPQGCESLRTPLVVTVNAAPALTSASTIAPVCNQTAIAYTPTASITGATFAWSRATTTGIATAAATGTGAINENLNNTTANPVNVNYVYTITEPTNGCTGTATVVATVNPAATLTSATAAPAICNNNVFAYTPTSATAGTTFAWSRATVTGISNAAGNGNGAINETLINTTANPVTVTYNYVLTANGCSNAQTVTVSVNPSATMSSALTANVCSGRAFKYTPVSATSGTAFAWSRAAVSGISNTAGTGTGAINETLINTTQAPINVTYTYTLTANACTNTQNLVVTVNPTPAKLVITADGPTVFCKEESVILRFNPTNTGAYQWYQDGVPVSGATATNTLVTTAGSFTAIVTNTYGCASDPSTAMVVEVPCEIGISLPDIFTPNGDGSNDKIKPIVPGIHKFSFFRVYNRWGNLVFESTDPDAAWDGSYKGEMQAQDSYSYVIEGYNFRSELIRKQGTITLVR